MNWKKELSRSLTSGEQLQAHIDLTPAEAKWFERPALTGLPFRLSPLFLKKIIANKDNPHYPLRRQSVPLIEEEVSLTYESDDPLCEDRFTPFPGLVHRYPSRALVYGGENCALYCRHCFRRHLTGTEAADRGIFSRLGKLTDWLIRHPEVSEVLISGGDPLLNSDRRISALLGAIREAGGERVIRICTRIPAVLPSRLTRKLVKILASNGPLWIVTQFNHTDEICGEVSSALRRLTRSGIPLLNQTVLLKGVNNDLDTLRNLCEKLVINRIKPYYIFQGDLAAGTSHLRVSLEEGLELMKQLRSCISGLAMPVYAVDLPGGGGKVPLTENMLKEKVDGQFCFERADGKRFYYPEESPDSRSQNKIHSAIDDGKNPADRASTAAEARP